MSPAERNIPRYIALVSGLSYLGLAVWALAVSHPHEDAFILFTYAEQVARGHGIVFYQGGPHAEGATDFLWMVLIAAAVRLGADAAVAAAGLNALGIAVISFLTCRYALQGAGKALQAGTGLGLALLLLTSNIAVASLVGFSTAFYCAISLCLFQITLLGSDRVLRVVPWICLLLGLVRPDGVILGGAFWLICLGMARDRGCLVPYLAHSLGAAVAGGGYFLWRWHYFGHLLPLPLYVKGHGKSRLPGLVANLVFLRENAILLLTATLGYFFTTRKRRYLVAFLPYAVLLLALSFATQSQNYGQRFQAPLLSALLFATALLLNDLCGAFRYRGASRLMLPLAVCAAIALGVGRFGYFGALAEAAPSTRRYIDVFPGMAGDLLTGDVRVALTEAGRMAYWNDAKTFDLVGLNTPDVAVNSLQRAFLDAITPDVFFIHTGGTMNRYLSGVPKTKVLTRDDLLGFSDRAKHWESIEDPIPRAVYGVYDYLIDARDAYQVAIARYGSDFHLYAVRRGGPVDFDAFLKRLNRSYDPGAQLAYLPLKAARNATVGR